MECQIKGEAVSAQIRAPKLRINEREPAVEFPPLPRRQEAEEVDCGTRRVAQSEADLRGFEAGQGRNASRQP